MVDGKMEHAFSIEMTSTNMCCLRALGELEELSMMESTVLEVRETNGILRIDLSEDELLKMLFQKKEVQ